MLTGPCRTSDIDSPLGNVTVWTAQNEYSYNPRNLYIAYGIGVFITIVVVIVGFVCIYTSSQSYGASFSTILRATRNEKLDELVTTRDTLSSQPLSKKLAQRRLIFKEMNALDDLDSTRMAFSPAEPREKVNGLLGVA